jgi:two-component system sensor kinase FixL
MPFATAEREDSAIVRLFADALVNAVPEPFPAAPLSAESQALLDAAADAVILITHRGIIEAFNSAAMRIFGYPTEEVLGRNVALLMTDSDARTHDAHIARYLSTQQAHIIGVGREVLGRRKDGSLFPALLSVGRIGGTDPPRFVGFLHDLTLRHQAMLALEGERDRANRTRERMLHVSRLATMGEIASGIAHELNQPLTAIANFAQASSRMLAAPTPDLEDVRSALDQIGAQALRAGKIIHHLRKLVGTRESQRELTDINDLIEETQTLTRADARDRNIQVRLQLSPDLPRLMVDRIQIQQVILNLFRNALDSLACVASGPRQLSTRTALNAGGDITVAVADTGRGVASEMLPTLFTPFSTNKPQGSGLGLAISRTIVEAHRGRLEYQANIPCGALFLLTLPK